MTIFGVALVVITLAAGSSATFESKGNEKTVGQPNHPFLWLSQLESLLQQRRPVGLPTTGHVNTAPYPFTTASAQATNNLFLLPTKPPHYGHFHYPRHHIVLLLTGNNVISLGPASGANHAQGKISQVFFALGNQLLGVGKPAALYNSSVSTEIPKVPVTSIPEPTTSNGTEVSINGTNSNLTAPDLSTSNSTEVAVNVTEPDLSSSNSTVVAVNGTNVTEPEISTTNSTVVAINGTNVTEPEISTSNSTEVAVNGSNVTELEASNSTVVAVNATEPELSTSNSTEVAVNGTNVTEPEPPVQIEDTRSHSEIEERRKEVLLLIREREKERVRESFSVANGTSVAGNDSLVNGTLISAGTNSTGLEPLNSTAADGSVVPF